VFARAGGALAAPAPQALLSWFFACMGREIGVQRDARGASLKARPTGQVAPRARTG
jgi:hypothetical protein